MLGQRRRRWPNIKKTVGQRLVLAGMHRVTNGVHKNSLNIAERMMFTWHNGEPQTHKWIRYTRARILVQVTINRRLLIGRDGHLDQSEAYDLS